MSDFQFFVSLVPWRMQRAKKWDDILSQNSEILMLVSVFKRFILKSPIKILVQPRTQSNFKGRGCIHVLSFFCAFVSNGVKFSQLKRLISILGFKDFFRRFQGRYFKKRSFFRTVSFWNICHRNIYRKTPKISPWVYIFKRPLWWVYKRGTWIYR